MRDDLNAIPVFVTVVESGNFAALQRLFGLADALQRFPALAIELLPLFRQQLPSGGTLE